MGLIISILLAVTNLVIVHTNDLENNFGIQKATWINPDFPPLLGGEASFRVFLKELKEDKKGAVFLLLNGGGMLGGNLIGQFTDFDATRRFMNEMGYDATTLGVKDFFHGADTLRRFVESLNIPVVCANLTYADDTSRVVNWVKPYIIVEKNGLRIGIFGLITEYMPIFSEKKDIKGLFFLREIPTARRVVKELKEKGVDLIIALAHITYKHEKMLLSEIPEIDLVIGGLDRGGTRHPTEDRVNHNIDVRTYGRLSGVGVFEARYSKKYRTIIDYRWHIETLFVDRFPIDLKEKTTDSQ